MALSLDVVGTEAGSIPDLDSVLSALHGRMRDTDSHEMFPARLWAREYGDFVEPVARFFIEKQSETIPNSLAVRSVTDDQEIRKEELSSYWDKACLAPSAYDMERRLKFLDIAGIKDSLIFGTAMSIMGQQWASGGGDLWEAMLDGGKAEFDGLTMGREMVRAHNDWCIRTAAISPRLRPVAAVMTDSLAKAMEETRRLIAGGVRAISIPTSELIEGLAPSHPDNDPFWKLLADNDVALLFHIGTEERFSREFVGWRNSPLFVTNRDLPSELPVDPFSLSVCTLPIQNYICNLVLGAVFERVPNLRCGVMELGAYWIGPTAMNMDVWAGYFARRYKDVLSMKPSEYVRRNIRVSPFTFEPVDSFIELYPFLEDVLCFSTDYPHFEGGKEPIANLADRMRRLGWEAAEKFFVKNAEWVMPG